MTYQLHRKNNLYHCTRAALALIALLSLGACLPDSESVREKRLQDFSSGEAASFATSLSSYSTQSHGALLRNAAFLNGTLNQGELGRSLDGVLANGYCHEGGGADTNHMLLAWYTQTDRDGEFTVKGIGKGAGAGIVQALSTHAAPQMIGYYGNNEIRLRGPRRNGETELAIPAGCDLDIPSGAPVLVLEHLSPNDQLGLAGGSYEYRTLSCEDSADIGARTERRAVRTQDDGTVMRGAWEIYDDTCDGAVSTRAVSIERSIGNLIGALDLTDAGSLQGALNGLAGLDCVKVKTGEKQTDADGNEIEEGEEIADTCDTRNIDVTKYKTDNDMERTDVRSREEMSVSCGRGDTGIKPKGQHNASYKGYSGAWNLHAGWSGTATYERFTFNAEQQSGRQSSVDGLQKGPWQGHDILCTRNESMNISCMDVFPEYNNASRYTPVRLDGMTVRRTNRISGWASKSPPSPNDPLSGDAGWVNSGAACDWVENGTYGCCGKLGHDWSQISTGRKERDIKAVNIKSASSGQWRDLGAAQCRQPYDYYWDDCTTTCTGTGEERECTESCVTRKEIRYNYASTDLYMCEDIEPPASCVSTGTCPPETDEDEEYAAMLRGFHSHAQEALDCANTSLTNGWYKGQGRCGDPTGIYYWEQKIREMGEEAAYALFLQDYDKVCQAMTGTTERGVCNSRMLCNMNASADAYSPNSDRCSGTYDSAYAPLVKEFYEDNVAMFDCDSDSPAAQWFRSQGRCGDTRGLEYWEEQARLYGEEAAMEQFLADYDMVCNQFAGTSDRAACNSAMFCNDGNALVNSSYCLGQSDDNSYSALARDSYGLGPQKLDCDSNSAANGFYQSVGRCGESGGIAYWEAKIDELGEEQAKAEFERDYAAICRTRAGTTDPAECNNRMLCATGHVYDANTDQCIRP